MQRVFLILTSTAAILAVHGAAMAQVTAADQVVSEADVMPEAPATVTPEAPTTQVPEAHCGCVSSLSNLLSMPGSDADAEWRHGGSLRPSAEPLWCEDPDDPRCAPMREGQQTPSGPSVPAPVSQSFAQVAVAAPLDARTIRVDQSPGESRPAHTRRLDRPPQG